MSMMMIPLMQEVITSVLLLVKFAIKAPLDPKHCCTVEGRQNRRRLTNHCCNVENKSNVSFSTHHVSSTFPVYPGILDKSAMDSTMTSSLAPSLPPCFMWSSRFSRPYSPRPVISYTMDLFEDSPLSTSRITKKSLAASSI